MTDPSHHHAEDAGGDAQVDATVGPTSRWGKPVTIAGAVLVVLAFLWAIFASGWFL